MYENQTNYGRCLCKPCVLILALKKTRVVCILSGGNIDTNILARALERGMASEGRLVKFKVTVSDRPGGMAELCSLMAHCGVTLRDCIPERAWVKGDVFSVEVLSFPFIIHSIFPENCRGIFHYHKCCPSLTLSGKINIYYGAVAILLLILAVLRHKISNAKVSAVEVHLSFTAKHLT